MCELVAHMKGFLGRVVLKMGRQEGQGWKPGDTATPRDDGRRDLRGRSSQIKSHLRSTCWVLTKRSLVILGEQFLLRGGKWNTDTVLAPTESLFLHGFSVYWLFCSITPVLERFYTCFFFWKNFRPKEMLQVLLIPIAPSPRIHQLLTFCHIYLFFLSFLSFRHVVTSPINT